MTQFIPIQSATQRSLLFVSGKGGVGKTTVSQAIAEAHANNGLRVLWATFEDPTRPLGEIQPVSPRLWYLNCEATASFEEYATSKLGGGAIAKVFIQNKLVRYLAKAAPGIHELVLLGKVWHERQNYDRVVVDMPSTGYGLAMFQSTINFSKLFRGGPIHRDADEMLQTFSDPTQTGHLIVALPEEMPLRESLELAEQLREYFPKNPPAFLVNRKFPALRSTHAAPDIPKDPDDWSSPVPADALDYSAKRVILEEANLKLWREEKIDYSELDYVHAKNSEPTHEIALEFKTRRYL